MKGKGEGIFLADSIGVKLQRFRQTVMSHAQDLVVEGTTSSFFSGQTVSVQTLGQKSNLYAGGP